MVFGHGVWVERSKVTCILTVSQNDRSQTKYRKSYKSYDFLVEKSKLKVRVWVNSNTAWVTMSARVQWIDESYGPALVGRWLIHRSRHVVALYLIYWGKCRLSGR